MFCRFTSSIISVEVTVVKVIMHMMIIQLSVNNIKINLL